MYSTRNLIIKKLKSKPLPTAVYYSTCPHAAVLSPEYNSQLENARPYNEVPGPKPLPIVGNTWRYNFFYVFYCKINLILYGYTAHVRL